MDARYWTEDTCYDPSRRAAAPTAQPPVPGPCAPSQMALLADSSSHLRNLQAKLTRVQTLAAPLPVSNPMAQYVDDRMHFLADRIRKSVQDPRSFDSMGSELYPMPNPPRVDFLTGTNSRLDGRPPGVVSR